MVWDPGNICDLGAREWVRRVGDQRLRQQGFHGDVPWGWCEGSAVQRTGLVLDKPMTAKAESCSKEEEDMETPSPSIPRSLRYN